uniref:Uncharacterized protein n=1 Tax=Oryza meridionalis TaxID=40149 RepID=A0A0E0CNM7_9ORYZ
MVRGCATSGGGMPMMARGCVASGGRRQVQHVEVSDGVEAGEVQPVSMGGWPVGGVGAVESMRWQSCPLPLVGLPGKNPVVVSLRPRRTAAAVLSSVFSLETSSLKPLANLLSASRAVGAGAI